MQKQFENCSRNPNNTQQLSTMTTLFENGQKDLTVTVINAGYNQVTVKYQIDNCKYCVFSIETFPQSDLQGTKPVMNIPITEEDLQMHLPVNPPIQEEAFEYWTSNAEKNADGTHKGGMFGAANLGLAGEIFIGDTIGFHIVENTKKNTIINITSINTSACKTIKAYACQESSIQAVVDTPNLVMINEVVNVYVITRGLVSKTVDYPSTPQTKSIAIAGGGFVGGNQTVQEAHDAETKEEGALSKNAIVMQTFNLPQRTDGNEEPRYCKFSFIGKDGTIKEFGNNRGRINNIQVRYFGELDELPIMYKATDKNEVMAGYWMPVYEFLAITNDPTTEQGRYVPWVAHQAIINEAVTKIENI